MSNSASLLFFGFGALLGLIYCLTTTEEQRKSNAQKAKENDEFLIKYGIAKRRR